MHIGRNKKHEKKKLNQHAFDKAIIKWRAPEYHQHEKSTLWFAIAGLVGAALVYYGLKTDGWTFSIAIIAFAGAYYAVHRKRPPVVEAKISKMGIKVGHHVFPYSNLKHFWIVYNPPFVKRLYFREVSRLRPDIFVSMENADPAEIRNILREHMAEIEGRHEPFSDVLVRLFRL